MTNDLPVFDSQADLPSYERLIVDQLGADGIARNRTEIRATAAFGDPRSVREVGTIAPQFALADTSGTLVSLASLRAQGPVVVIFYRGGWCPFCNVYLRTFQLARPQLRALGAQVVLISPQQAEYAQPLSERQALLFPVLSDLGNQVARQYGLVFQMAPNMREAYRADGVDLATINGDESWELPMPATFVVDSTGVIQYAFVSADYTQRAEPTDVIAVLRRLKSRRT